MTPIQAPAPSTAADRAKDNPFRYGWRIITKTLEDGSQVCEHQPLTLEDVLHPREGDVIPENTQHDLERTYVADVCRARVARRRGALVLSDCLIDWGVEGRPALSPDLALLFDVADPLRRRGTFYVAREGTQPVLLMEIVSPDTRENDVTRKFEEYYDFNVPFYVIVDQVREDGPRSIRGFRHTPDGYEPVALDEQGRLLLAPLGLLLGLRDNWIVCYDAATGEELGDYAQVSEALEREQQARLTAEKREPEQSQARAEAERLAREQSQARVEAERLAVEQSQARAEAERLAREQSQARVEAERLAREQTKAREEAENRAREQAAAAAKRIQELEAELRRVRGEPTDPA